MGVCFGLAVEACLDQVVEACLDQVEEACPGQAEEVNPYCVVTQVVQIGFAEEGTLAVMVGLAETEAVIVLLEGVSLGLVVGAILGLVVGAILGLVVGVVPGLIVGSLVDQVVGSLLQLVMAQVGLGKSQVLGSEGILVPALFSLEEAVRVAAMVACQV